MSTDRSHLRLLNLTTVILASGLATALSVTPAHAGMVTVTGAGSSETFADIASAMAWASDPSRSMNHYDVQASGSKNSFGGFDIAANTTLRWGNSPGVIELLGTRQVPYTFSGTTVFDIGGTDNSDAFSGGSNVDYDTMLVLGGPGVNFDGVLQINLVNGFTPVAGQQFELIATTGMINWYGSVQGPVLGNGLTWAVSILPGSLEGQSVFVMSVVPAPSAIALVACCGVWARRRRR